jgi:hypothetical protein
MARLKKALYRLKQSPWIWYNILANFLASQGFQPFNANISIFIKKDIIIIIYINNLLIAKDLINNIKILKIILNNKFKILNLGICYFYLNMEIIKDRPWRVLKLS